MTFSKPLRLPFAIMCLAIPAQGAVTVINNFGAGTQGFAAGLSGPTAVSFFSPYEDRQVAFSFGTGPVPVQLLSLRFRVSIEEFLSPIHGQLSTGSPVAGPVSGVSIGTVTPPSNSPVSQVLEMSPPTTVTLAPNTTYWVHLTVPAGDAVYSFHNNNAVLTEPGWSLGNTFMYDPVDGWLELTSGPQARIQMDVTAVPEPGTAGLAAAVVAVLSAARRRR